MGNVIARNDDETLLNESFLIWTDYVDNNMTYAQIAEKYDISERTVGNRIDRAKQYYFDQIKDLGDKHSASISRQLDWALRELKEVWKNNKDPAVMAQIRGILSDLSKLWGLSAAPKAPVNKQGDAVLQPIVFIMDESQYKAVEEKHKRDKENTIEGTLVETTKDEKINGSTTTDKSDGSDGANQNDLGRNTPSTE